MLGSPLRNLVSILSFVAIVVILATIAYMRAGWSFADAFYMVVLTVYTVGYGEVRPIDTPYLHAVTMATMFLGCTGMILLTSALVQVFTVLQLREMFGVDQARSRIERLDGHAIICGFGRIGVTLARELERAGTAFVILERSPDKIEEAQGLGFLSLAGDATDESALHAAGIDRARVLATVLPDDAANVFITLSARSLNPRIEIIARGEVPATERKLRHAGADRVVMPTHIGAERIAEMILHPAAEGVLRGSERMQEVERGLRDIGLELAVMTVAASGAMDGMTVAAAERRGAGAFFVTQIDRVGGETVVRPASSVRIEAGDVVTLVVRQGRDNLRTLFEAAAEPVRAGRTTFRR